MLNLRLASLCAALATTCLLMYSDDELVMISALQHCMFCRRQCALIHLEGVWRENFLTAAGRVMHERVDSGGAETRRDVHVATSLRLLSRRLGVMGVADMVEFRRFSSSYDPEGRIVAARLNGRDGWWRPYPLEYKRGKPKEHRADEVQLCAQAICLEEMLGVEIREGALFYGEPRRRMVVNFDVALRDLTEAVAREAHELIAAGVTPPPVITKGCDACSLKELCIERSQSVRNWIEREIVKIIGS